MLILEFQMWTHVLLEHTALTNIWNKPLIASVVHQVNIALQAQQLLLASVQLATYALVARVHQHLQVHLHSLIIQPATQALAQLVIIAPMDQVIQDHVLLDTIKI